MSWQQPRSDQSDFQNCHREVGLDLTSLLSAILVDIAADKHLISLL